MPNRKGSNFKSDLALGFWKVFPIVQFNQKLLEGKPKTSPSSPVDPLGFVGSNCSPRTYDLLALHDFHTNSIFWGIEILSYVGCLL